MSVNSLLFELCNKDFGVLSLYEKALGPGMGLGICVIFN